MFRTNVVAALVILFSYTGTAAAQYSLQSAFPNLSAFSRPIELVHAGDGTNRFFLVEQDGRIWVFENSASTMIRRLFLDLSDSVSQGGSETGLLGLAFHPDYENNGYFYVNYTRTAGSLKSYITRFQVSSSDPDSADESSGLILVVQNQPYSNHNGGKVAFGLDGYLYIALGDGGSGGDPQGNGQNRATILGKILRIDVDDTSGGRNYAIPPTNPYYQNTQGFREEIYSYGMRNPWKFSFDPLTGRLWCADVGQSSREEVDIIDNGGNYGWNKMEGFLCYPSSSCDTAGHGFLRPVWDYPRSQGFSVTGGYVYRGTAIPNLIHKYVYGDYGSGRIWALSFNGTSFTNTELLDSPYSISSFGVDTAGTIYIVSYGTGVIYKLTGPSSGLTLLSPSDGESYDPGDQLDIQWLASGPANVDLFFKSAPGAAWDTIAANVNAADGSYSWTVPSYATNKARIRVSESGGALTDSSDGYFTIRLALIAASRSTVDLDTVYTTDIGLDTLTIWNPGTAELMIDSTRTRTGIFTVSRDTFTLAPSASDTISIVCSSSQIGEFTDTLTIFHQGDGTPIEILLHVVFTQNPNSIGDGSRLKFVLYTNHPNPFNNSTMINYQLAMNTKATLRIYNALGQEVRTLVNGHQTTGSHEVTWDGRDNFGRTVASGVYLYRLEAGGQVKTRKLVLLK
jgi:glucose/arabinose dehydrogenase